MVLATAGRNAAANGIVDLLDSGTIVGQTSGGVEVFTCTFGATAFGDASTGVATANAITSDTSATGGTVAKAKYMTSGGAEVAEITVSILGGAGEMQLDTPDNTLNIPVGSTIAVSSCTVTMPAS